MFGFLQTATLIIFVSALFSMGCSPQQFALAPASQSFGQVITYNKQVDILMVIDTSSSMAQKQAQLSQQFYPFINYLAQSGFDFHVAVTTMDMSPTGAQGALVGSPLVLTSQTANIQNAFVGNISQGPTGSDLSRGLLAMQTALGSGMLSGLNSGFLRSSAMLAVVFMSDEDDESTGTTQSYIDFLNALKPPFPYGGHSWVSNSIVVPSLSSQCTSYEQYISVGTRYIALSTASNGTIESICGADLVQASSDIQERIAEMLTSYQLNRPANPSSIAVTINGVTIPNDPTNGWTFDVPSNTITFHGTAIPTANSAVQVAYQPLTIES